MGEELTRKQDSEEAPAEYGSEERGSPAIRIHASHAMMDSLNCGLPIRLSKNQ